MSRSHIHYLALVTLVLAALALAAPLWGPGLVNTRGGGDSPFLLQRTHQLAANLRAGVFPVRWMPDGAYGFGFPFFNYYSALPYYVAAVLALAGLDVLSALKVVQTLGFVAAAVAMYGWVWRLSRNRWAAWLAGVAYTAAPFHLVNVYVRGDSLSEFFAFAFYPLILWGLETMLDGESASLRLGRHTIRVATGWLWSALAYAGLILTHNISALLFSPFVALYVLGLVLRHPRRWRHVLSMGSLVLAFGLLLSAWVWVPALAETGLVQAQTLTDDYFHHSRHFRTADLVQRGVLFSYSVAPGGETPFAMGLPQALAAVLGGLALVVDILRRRSGHGGRGRAPAGQGFVLAGLLVSTLMITPLSRVLWDHLPLLPMTQFPWRFLSVQALFAAATAAALAPKDNRGLYVAVPIAGLLVASVFLPLHPDRLPVGPTDVTVERLQTYELFTQNIGTTIRYEWLPRDAVPRPFTSDALVDSGELPGAIPLDGAAVSATMTARGPTAQEWHVNGDGGSIALPLLAWPGWQASVDGKVVEVWTVEGSGFLALAVPPGEHRVTLRLGRTPVRAAAELASLGALVAIVAYAVVVRRQVHWRSTASRLGLVVVPALMAMFLPSAVPSGASVQTMDFDQMPFLHDTPGGVVFREGPRLISYSLSAEKLAPGEPLNVRLDWAGVDGVYTATTRLLSPAALRHEVEPLAEATRRISEAGTDVVLELPADLSRGTYLVQLRLSDADGEIRALTPGGRLRGPIYLRPVRVPRGPVLPADESVLASFGPSIRLHSAEVAPGRSKSRVAVRLDWSLKHQVAGNYGISLRMLDAEGSVTSAIDTQPGYGYLPTSMWRPGELVADRYVLVLPRGFAKGSNYNLQVILYQVSSGAVVGQAHTGNFVLPLTEPFEASRPRRLFALPAIQCPVGVTFGEEIRLAGYSLEHGGQSVGVTLWWQSLQTPGDDYTVFVHLFDQASGDVVAQDDAMPQGGAYPTSWWVSREVVSETVSLPLADLSPGEYGLAVGLYDRTVTRLRAIGQDGERVPDDRVILAETVEVR